MSDSREQAAGRLYVGAGCLVFGLAVVAFLLSGGTGLLWGSIGIVGVPIAVGLLIVGTAKAGSGPVVKAIAVVLFVGAIAGTALLFPVVRALNLEVVVIATVLIGVTIAGLGIKNSQQLRRREPHVLFNDEKGYDGRSDDREWIPEDDGNDR